MSYRNRNKVLEDENIKRDSAIDTKASFDPANRGRPTKFNRKNWMGSILAAHLAEGGGSSNVSIPLKFPLKTDFNTTGIIGNATYNIPVDLDGYQGYILTLSGDVSLHLEQTASESKLYPLYFVIRQDTTGGHSIVGLDANIENATFTQLDAVLNKDASAQTVFKLTNPSGSKWIIEKISLSGAQGAQGDQGVQGDQGARGARGSQGNTGTQGSQGNMGATGSTGATGSAGPQGSQGNTGSDGTDATSSFSQAAIDGLAEITSGVALAIERITDDVALAIKRISDDVALAIKRITDDVALAIKRITDLVAEAILRITDLVAEAILRITDLVAAAILRITDLVAAAILRITDLVAAAILRITDLVAAAILRITDLVVAAILRITEDVKLAIERITVEVARGLELLTDTTVRLLERLTTTLVNNIEAIFDSAGALSTAFTNLISNLVGNLDANKNLSNLGDSVAINKALNFKLNTNTGGGASTNSFGFDVGNNMYLKMSGPADIFRIQAGTVTQIEIANRGIKLVDGVGDPTANGEIKRVGSTIKIKVNNSVKDLADIGSGSGGGGGGGGGGGSETVTANQFIIKNASNYNSASGSVLDTDYGSERGCIGIRCDTAVSITSDNTKVYLYIKSSSFWFGLTMTARLSSTRTLVGTAYGTSNTKRRIKYTTSSSDDATESLVGTVEGRLYTHQQSGDSDDGSFGIYSDGLKAFDYGAALDVTSTDDSGTTITLLDTIPTTQLQESSLNNSALDSAYGSGEGAMGFNRNTNDLFIKVNGYWWYRVLYVQ